MRRASLLHIESRHLMGQHAVHNIHKQAITPGLGVWFEDKKRSRVFKDGLYEPMRMQAACECPHIGAVTTG